MRTDDGRVVRGQVVWNGFRKSIVRMAPNPQRPDDTVEISKRHIESYHPSPDSPMPAGLLDSFHADEIADLLAYLEAGGSG